LWLIVRLVPLQKAIIQIDLYPQLLRGVSQLLNKFGIEFDGKETYVMHNGVKLAMRRDDRWVSIEPASQFVTSS
jgi:hypothetical protein